MRCKFESNFEVLKLFRKPIKVPSLARSVPKPLQVPSLARSVPKPLKEPSLAFCTQASLNLRLVVDSDSGTNPPSQLRVK